MKKFLKSAKSPEPIGPYSQAVGFEKLIFTSGQIALDTSGSIVSDDIFKQTEKVIENLKNILEDNGSSLEKVIKTTVFLKDMQDFASMNEVYNKYFGKSMPARSTVEVSRLPKDVKVEIEVIAYN
ncbi:MAG: 2-iminobutanoate/2-iminopropanoate deaminase [Ignavibacteria bacterium]|nr:2-iminobutanoate/2-iminopropanoate deaminase [Ignavibacteria bacterium]